MPGMPSPEQQVALIQQGNFGSIGGWGKFTSLALDSDDMPHISFGTLIPSSFFSLHYASLVPDVTQPTEPPPSPTPSPGLVRQINPALLTLQFLNIFPQQTSVNQPVTISTNVVNSGDEGGNLNVALKVNGVVEETRMVSVGPQASQPVKFTVTRDKPGTYTVDIADQKGSFTVVGENKSGAASSRTIAVVAGLLIGVVGIAVVVTLLLRRV